MIKGSLPSFRPGMRSFSASKMNNLVQAVQQIDKRQSIGAANLSIRNSSGSDLPIYSILAYGDSVNDPTANISSFLGYAVLDGDIPDGNIGYGKFAVLQEGAIDGQTVPVVIQGITQVKINVIDANHIYADVTDGETGYLTSADIGSARILWKETGTGEKWALVLIGGPMDDYLLVYNSSGVVIPANSATEVDSIDQNNGAHKLVKPSADSLIQVIITDDFDIAATSYALVKKTYPKKVAYNSTAPVAGDTLGTVEDQWYMETGKSGFQSNGSISASGVALVSPFRSGWISLPAFSFSHTSATLQGGDLPYRSAWYTLPTSFVLPASGATLYCQAKNNSSIALHSKAAYYPKAGVQIYDSSYIHGKPSAFYMDVISQDTATKLRGYFDDDEMIIEVGNSASSVIATINILGYTTTFAFDYIVFQFVVTFDLVSTAAVPIRYSVP